MTTRKTTTGYKVTVDFCWWNEKFDFYEDVKVCFKPVLRGYNLDDITTDFKLDDWQIDYLLGNTTKKQVLEDDICRSEDDFKELDEYKKKYEVVGLSIGEHSQFAIGYGNDGVMLVEKNANQDYIHELVKELESWFNGWIYRVDIHEPEKFTSEDTDAEIIHWNYVDGQGGYFNPEDALNDLPEYAGEIIKESESERFEEFERC